MNKKNLQPLQKEYAFDVTLQLLRMGFQNKVSLEFRVGQISTQASGGCAEYRTIDLHNKCMRELAILHKNDSRPKNNLYC